MLDYLGILARKVGYLRTDWEKAWVDETRDPENDGSSTEDLQAPNIGGFG